MKIEQKNFQGHFSLLLVSINFNLLLLVNFTIFEAWEQNFCGNF